MCNCQENEDRNKSYLFILYFNVSVPECIRSFVVEMFWISCQSQIEKHINVLKNHHLKRSTMSDM